MKLYRISEYGIDNRQSRQELEIFRQQHNQTPEAETIRHQFRLDQQALVDEKCWWCDSNFDEESPLPGQPRADARLLQTGGRTFSPYRCRTSSRIRR